MGGTSMGARGFRRPVSATNAGASCSWPTTRATRRSAGRGLPRHVLRAAEDSSFGGGDLPETRTLEAAGRAQDAAEERPEGGEGAARQPRASVAAAADGDGEPSGLYPDDWEEWVEYMERCRSAETESRELDRLIARSAGREDYAEAQRLKGELSALMEETPDAVGGALEELRGLLDAQDFSRAASLRDEAGTRYEGWWVGRCEERDAGGFSGPQGVAADHVDPYGHIVVVEPRHSHFAARAFGGADLAQTYHSTKNDGSSAFSPASSSSAGGGEGWEGDSRARRGPEDLNFQDPGRGGVGPSEQPAGDEDGFPSPPLDGMLGIPEDFAQHAPGERLWELYLRGDGCGGYRRMAVTYSLLASESQYDLIMGGGGGLGVPEELRDLLGDLDAPLGGEEEERDIFRRADEDGDPGDWQTDTAADLGELISADYDREDFELVEEPFGMETLGEEPRPAQLVSLPGDLDAFEVVWQHPRVEFGCAGGAAGDLVGPEAPTSDVSVLQRSKSGAYAELLVALKELVRDAETRAGGAEDTPLADIYQEVAEVGPRSAGSGGEGQLVVSYRRLRLGVSHWNDPFDGVFFGNYGVHGTEVLQLRREMLASDDGVIEEHVVATKLTGDPNVPAGRVTFRANISRRKRVSFSSSAMQSWQMHKEYRYPEELQVRHLYPGRGQIADEGFTDPRWVDGELLVLDPRSPIGDGAPLAFVFCMEEPPVDFVGEGAREVPAEDAATRKVVILLHKLDLTRKKEAAGRA